MNKTVNINRELFPHRWRRFCKASKYLDAIKKSLSDPREAMRLSAISKPGLPNSSPKKLERSTQVVTVKEVDEVIAVMGQPEDYAVDEELFEDTPKSKRSRSDTNNCSVTWTTNTSRGFLRFRPLFGHRCHLDPIDLGIPNLVFGVNNHLYLHPILDLGPAWKPLRTS